MKITVVTVCYNSQDTIEKTIKSVLNQSYRDVEYIIVDGASTDNTMVIVDRYIDNGIKVISEKDNGLYDAMNKATSYATGEFILYMNSGDIFVDNNVIEDIVPHLTDEVDMLYGGTIRIKPEGEIVEKYHGKNIVLKLLLQGKMMCHQSMFTRTSVMREYGFDMMYSITADYDFVARIASDKKSLVYIDRLVSKVDNIEGISSSVRNMDEMRRQDDMSLKKHFPVWYAMVTPPKKVIRFVRRMNERKFL